MSNPGGMYFVYNLTCAPKYSLELFLSQQPRYEADAYQADELRNVFSDIIDQLAEVRTQVLTLSTHSPCCNGYSL